ncbi:MAG: N-acetylmuramoyl-L-alanine amidase, partial [Gammaproteobacteria bacterium]
MDRFSATRRFFLKRFARYGATLTLLASSGISFAKSKPALVGVRVAETSVDHTRIVFDLSSGIEHRLFSLSKPNRIVIDLKNTRKSNALTVNKNNTSLLSGIRSAMRKSGELRIVLDLKSNVRPRSFILKPDGNSGYRLVVDLHATNLDPTPIVTSQQQRQKRKKEIIIAIDAGHGGRDP